MNKTIYVNGEVRSFNENDNLVIYLTQRTSQNDYHVFLVRLSSLAAAAQLSIGDTVRIPCRLSVGEPFFTGKEIECRQIGNISSTNLVPTPTAHQTPAAAETPTPQIVSSTPTFDERRQAVIRKYCGSNNPIQACVDKVGSEYCVPFYENPVEHLDRQLACSFIS